MIENLGGATSQLATIALDIALQRHEVIAHNVANASTPGFVPKHLDFDAQLSKLALEIKQNGANTDVSSQISTMRQELANGDRIESLEGHSVEVDMEIAELTENVLRYHALLDALSKRTSILKMAITGGK